jgi:hypothetical protein
MVPTTAFSGWEPAVQVIERVRAKMPEAAEYLDKHIVMDDEKMTFAYTDDGRIRLEPPF